MSFGIKHKWYFTLIFPEAFQLHLFCIVGSHIECNMNCPGNAFYIDSISNLKAFHHIHIIKRRIENSTYIYRNNLDNVISCNQLEVINISIYLKINYKIVNVTNA